MNNTPIEEKDVCLVLMPYAALERPSIALSILKATLDKVEISSKVIYGNLMFAEEIGPQIFDMLTKSQSHCLIGEWTFSAAAFKGFSPDHDAYFKHVTPATDGLQSFVTAMGSNIPIEKLLWRIREQVDAFIEKMALHILQHRPKIVGCSSTFQQHCASLALLRKIKELSPDIVTMLGGANCESSMGVVTHENCPWLDYVFSGEADVAFPLICQQLVEVGPYEDIQDYPFGTIGPLHRSPKQYTLLRIGAPRAKLKDMNDSPMPEYDDYFNYLKYNEIGQYIKPGLLIETSRGCWWGAIKHCTFCGLNGESMGHRSKDEDTVYEEIITLHQKYDIPRIEAVDNILDMKYFQNLLPKLAEYEEKVEFFYETKANLRKEHLQLLAKAGVTWIQPGIESLDDTLLDLIDKGTKARHNVTMMKWAQECGIYLIWVWLYDIPGDNDDLYLNMAEWLPLISHLQTPGGLSFIQYNRFSPYHMYPEKYNLKLSPERAYSFVYPWDSHSLEDFVYYFDDYTREREQIQSFDEQNLDNPGLRAIKKVFHDWQQGWVKRMYPTLKNLPEPDTLVYLDNGESISITDTRKCRVQDKFELTGLDREIYILCDNSLTFPSILRHLNQEKHTEEDILKVVRQLVEQKILLHLGEFYISLAVKGPLKHIPPRVEYPGGRVISTMEAQGQSMMAYAASVDKVQLARFNQYN